MCFVTGVSIILSTPLYVLNGAPQMKERSIFSVGLKLLTFILNE